MLLMIQCWRNSPPVCARDYCEKILLATRSARMSREYQFLWQFLRHCSNEFPTVFLAYHERGWQQGRLENKADIGKCHREGKRERKREGSNHTPSIVLRKLYYFATVLECYFLAKESLTCVVLAELFVLTEMCVSQRSVLILSWLLTVKLLPSVKIAEKKSIPFKYLLKKSIPKLIWKILIDHWESIQLISHWNRD